MPVTRSYLSILPSRQSRRMTRPLESVRLHVLVVAVGCCFGLQPVPRAVPFRLHTDSAHYSDVNGGTPGVLPPGVSY